MANADSHLKFRLSGISVSGMKVGCTQVGSDMLKLELTRHPLGADYNDDHHYKGQRYP